MLVVNVGVVRMVVRHRFVPMRVRVADIRGNRRRMRVPVMFVMRVFVLVLQRLVGMHMLVPLREVQPHARGHQGTGDE